jgi:hypothetical protein
MVEAARWTVALHEIIAGRDFALSETAMVDINTGHQLRA